MFPSVIPVFPPLSFPTLVPDPRLQTSRTGSDRGSSVIGNPGFCSRRARTLSSLSSPTFVIGDPVLIGNPGFCSRRTHTNGWAEKKDLSSSPPPPLSSSTLVPDVLNRGSRQSTRIQGLFFFLSFCLCSGAISMALSVSWRPLQAALDAAPTTTKGNNPGFLLSRE